MTPAPRNAILFAALVVLGAGWGITQPLAKIAVSEGYRNFGIIFWQMLFGAAFLGLFLVLRGRKPVLGPAQWRMALIIALIGTVLPNAASYQAAVYLPAGIISILLSTVPMLAFPIALGLKVERFAARRLLGLGLGLVGVLVLTLPEASLPDPAIALFVPLALVAPFFYALEGNVVARFGTADLDPVELLFAASAIGTVVALPLALISGTFIAPHTGWAAPDWAILASSLIHAVVYTGYVALVRRAGSVFAVQVSYLVTGFGVIWAMTLLGERYSGAIWAAMGLMFLGMALVQPRPLPPLAVPVRTRQDTA